MRVAVALGRGLTRIGFAGIGFIVHMRLSARAYRRRLIRAGVPRAHAELLYRDFKATGIGSIFARDRSRLASRSEFAVGSEERRQQ